MIKTAIFGDIIVAPFQKGLVTVAETLDVPNKKVYSNIAKEISGTPIVLGAPLPAYSPSENTIYLKSKTPGMLAHEAGHALNQRHILGKMVHHPIARLPGMFSPFAAIGLGIYSGYKDELEGTDSRLRDAGIGAIVASPTLLGEAAASIRGDALMRRSGATAKALRNYRLGMLAALGTYGLVPVASAINYDASRTIGKHFANVDRKYRKH